MEKDDHDIGPDYPQVIAKLINVIIILLLVIILLIVINITGLPRKGESKKVADIEIPEAREAVIEALWSAPDTGAIAQEPDAGLIKYGKALIANTSYYIGPHGKITHLANGMNCQNCHLEAGTKPFGNNYGAVASTYPKFRERSGTLETIHKRVNDCIERSLNGKALDTSSREMQAMMYYIKWLGKDVAKGERPKGAGLTELAYLERAADPEKGKVVYEAKCERCHSADGEGQWNTDGLTYKYPPLWGNHSYNIGAGLYRLSRFAGYVKSNMPQGVTFREPQLSDEEAWDVAAFVNSQPRPGMDLKKDWPKISGKPVDHPFGPYADHFSEQQHKYGPFGPIAEGRKKKEK